MKGQGRLTTRLLASGLAVALAACEGPPADDDLEGASEAIPLAETGSCPRPPAGTHPQAEKAYDRVNAYRKAVGLPCVNVVPEIAAAAAAHCGYYVANRGACVASPHREVATCKGFTGERFSDRLRAASYGGNPAYEAMTYVGSGAQAVDKWVDSVWHRIPILSPWVNDVGYGTARSCDTMDFAWAAAGSAPAAPVTYPYAGQTKVPTSFDGRLESPVLPAPPRGWPSGYPIIVYARDLTATTHELRNDRGEALPHVWLTPADAAATHGILRNEALMYAHAPLEKRTTYTVVVAGTRQGQPVRLEWSFTTR